MLTKERRLSPRKTLAIPMRFRATNRKNSTTQPGLTSNFSEHGVHFITEQRVTIGAPVELFVTLPKGVARRKIKEVRCIGRVIHVQSHLRGDDVSGVGVCIERYEPADVGSWLWK
jgi:PilZ domain-containing protein